MTGTILGRVGIVEPLFEGTEAASPKDWLVTSMRRKLSRGPPDRDSTCAVDAGTGDATVRLKVLREQAPGALCDLSWS